MRKIKRIQPLPFALFQALLAAHIGLLLGFLYSFGGLIYDLFLDQGINTGTGLAFFALLGMPLILAAGGFCLGLLEALLYNIFAKWHGGISFPKNFIGLK